MTEAFDILNEASLSDLENIKHNEESALLLGTIVYKLGRHTESLKLFETAIILQGEDDPTPLRALAYSNIGHVLTSLDRPNEAIVKYRCALQINPQDTDTMCELASLLLESEAAYEEAEMLYLQAINENPNNVKCHVNLGVLYSNTEEIAKARHHFEIATSLSPELPLSWKNLGIIASLQRNLDVAVKCFTVAHKLIVRCTF